MGKAGSLGSLFSHRWSTRAWTDATALQWEVTSCHSVKQQSSNGYESTTVMVGSIPQTKWYCIADTKYFHCHLPVSCETFMKQLLYAQKNVTFAIVLSLSSFVHKLARVTVMATCNSANMCHFEVSGSSPSFIYNAKEFLVMHAPWSGMNLDVCTLPYEFLTEQFGFLQQFSNEFCLLLHIVLQLATKWEVQERNQVSMSC